LSEGKFYYTGNQYVFGFLIYAVEQKLQQKEVKKSGKVSSKRTPTSNAQVSTGNASKPIKFRSKLSAKN